MRNDAAKIIERSQTVSSVGEVLQLQQRGYYVAYRENEVNYCPGCGRSHWHIGRLLAECAFCATALPLLDTLGGVGTFRSRGTRYAPSAMEAA